MDSPEQPHLEAPGAGLPPIELAMARRIFAFKCWKGTRETHTANFLSEQSKIRHLIESCSEKQRRQPVLIPRLRGLEDSSRFYSIWMTLDHLRITNLNFQRFIIDLSQNSLPQMVVNTANVKPNREVTVQIETDYERSCDELIANVAKVQDLKTRLRFSHPWFGPLDAYRWYALANMHMGIHRAQIAAIIHQLKK